MTIIDKSNRLDIQSIREFLNEKKENDPMFPPSATEAYVGYYGGGFAMDKLSLLLRDAKGKNLGVYSIKIKT